MPVFVLHMADQILATDCLATAKSSVKLLISKGVQNEVRRTTHGIVGAEAVGARENSHAFCI